VHLQAAPFFENVRALIATSVGSARCGLPPLGDGNAVYPLVRAEDVARVTVTLLLTGSSVPERAYELVSETATANGIASTLSTVLKRPHPVRWDNRRSVDSGPDWPHQFSCA
jgi:uncharacterized protein YbjT (DUF2867 family)